VIERLTVRNYRGRAVPAVLGFVVAGGGAVSAVLVGASQRVSSAGFVADGAALLVFAAGLVDDLAPHGPRGTRAHLRRLARGEVSTGVVKVLVIVGASIVTVAAGTRSDGLVRVAGVVLVAGASNVWNGLDVRPGRALKFALPVIVLLRAFPWRLGPFVPGVLLAGVLTLPWDVGERAMLGDAGANTVGFAIGLACYLALASPLVVVGAVAVVALNVA